MKRKDLKHWGKQVSKKSYKNGQKKHYVQFYLAHLCSSSRDEFIARGAISLQILRTKE